MPSQSQQSYIFTVGRGPDKPKRDSKPVGPGFGRQKLHLGSDSVDGQGGMHRSRIVKLKLHLFFDNL